MGILTSEHVPKVWSSGWTPELPIQRATYLVGFALEANLDEVGHVAGNWADHLLAQWGGSK